MTTSPVLTISDDTAAAPPLLFAYYNATAAEQGQPTWDSPDDLPHYFRVDYADPAAYYAAPGGYLVARLDGRPVGGVGYRFLGPDIEVKRLYVVPEARGVRIARSLMHALHQRALAAGAERCILDVLPSRTAAIALYEKLGYRRIPPYHPAYEGVELDCFALDLAL